MENQYRYRMDRERRGKFIIFNNKTFHPRTKMNVRKGTDVDATALEKDFKKLGFDVEVHHDRTALQMYDIMEKGRITFIEPCGN
jgi:hypothetical protein